MQRHFWKNQSHWFLLYFLLIFVPICSFKIFQIVHCTDTPSFIHTHNIFHLLQSSSFIAEGDCLGNHYNLFFPSSIIRELQPEEQHSSYTLFNPPVVTKNQVPTDGKWGKGHIPFLDLGFRSLEFFLLTVSDQML